MTHPRKIPERERKNLTPTHIFTINTMSMHCTKLGVVLFMELPGKH